MNPSLYRALWRIKHFRDTETLQALSLIRHNEWLSQDELAAKAWEKQKILVSHAFANCPYYQRKYASVGFQPGDLKHPEDFSLLPVLTKQEIREHLEEIVAQGTDRSVLLKRFTGGSTGSPLMVYHDARAAISVWCLYQRTIERWGIRLGDKIGHLWGLNRLNQEFLYSHQSWWQRTLKNHVLLDAFDLTEVKMEEFARLLRTFRPHMLISYTTALTAFAHYLKETGGAGFAPQAIWMTAEVTLDSQRELVEEVFQGPVYDQYGSNEILHYAAQCERREHLHIDSDFRVLETTNDDGRPTPLGEVGLVVGTDLVNLAVPLIRYRNEDMAKLITRPCPCGRGLPLLSKVIGRVHDMIVLPDGTQVYGLRFSAFFYDYVEQVQAFQVHQTSLDRTLVKIVPTAKCDRESLIAMANQKFREYTKGQVAFEIQFVEEIPKEASGKYRFTKSDVAQQQRR